VAGVERTLPILFQMATCAIRSIIYTVLLLSCQNIYENFVFNLRLIEFFSSKV